jgi:S1-C subfamily serine protease
MDDTTDWSFPADLQPQQKDWGFDLEAALGALVQIRASVPEDAFTASILGTERAGNGVVIREDGLILTIGYLITEAQSIWITTGAGRVVAGHPLAYDQPTGFGLVQPLGRLDAPALARGSAAGCRAGDAVVVAGHGGRAHSLRARVFAKREFAGYWEYVLDEALFTAPAHPQWGGAAILDRGGRLIGIGSLLVEEKLGAETIHGNMGVPIDLLEPILDDLLRLGRAGRAPRPWLGMYAADIGERTVVAGLASGGPAEQAALEVGDVILEVAGEPVHGLADLFRRIWRLGGAGVEVPLTIARKRGVTRVRLRSIDRNDFLRKPRLH